MATIETGWFNGSTVGTPLMDLLRAGAIEPGENPSYQICKNIYEFHPIGKKMVDAPIAMAQSQDREITIPKGPEARVKAQFLATWARFRSDAHIANHARVSRIYGRGTFVLIVEGQEPSEPVDLTKIWDKRIGFNILDPLNTSSGANVLNQDPNSIEFQMPTQTVVQGKAYHPSRTCVLLNESPLYIAYTSSAFGFSGRSVYQRAIYPLKTFIQGMRTDDLVTRKVGVIIAKLKQVGSIIDNITSKVLGGKRELAKEAATDDVLSIGDGDTIESMDLRNLEAPYKLVRQNVLENLALSGDMPAKILNSETFAEGFGEGTEDAKNIARFVDGVRKTMQPSYDFMDPIIQRMAWTPEFYETIRTEFPDEYAGVDFNTAFYSWKNSFSATWPSLLTEPDSEKVKVDKVKLEGITSVMEVMLPMLDPVNKAIIVEWACNNLNEFKLLFSMPLELDYEALAAYVPPAPVIPPGDEQTEPEPRLPRADANPKVQALIDGLKRTRLDSASV